MFEIEILRRQGKSLKAIARETGYSINTVRRYARDFTSRTYKKRSIKPLKLDDFTEYLQARVQSAQPNWLPATVLFKEIQDMGYTGKIRLVSTYLRTLKPMIIERPIIRFETEPGEQMQVDFAHFKHNKDTFLAFVAILGFSRMLYVEFVANQQINTLIKCHENAFDYFAGVARYGLYDNMKTVIIQRNAYGPGNHRLHANFYDFAKHYGFVPRVCKPYNPQTKGKVERMISYLRYSFYNPLIAGKNTITLSELNIAVMSWLNEVANQRIHATTKAIPLEKWQFEKQHLLKIPINYTTSYGIKAGNKKTNQSKNIMENNSHSIQHDLTVYDSLLSIGGIL